MRHFILSIALLLLCGAAASAQEMHCTFVQNKTLKATRKVIPGSGSITFTAPDRLSMTYDSPEGDYLVIEGDELRSCSDGKVLKVDTSKNARMRKMRNTLLNCITGAYEEAAAENDADVAVEEKGDVKTVSLTARKQQASGYSRIIIDYNRKGLPVRMVLDEFTGIVTDYTFTY
jgi:outer membrane lipoprotein-sorting protein